jgi:hypothetical protein
MNVTQEYIDTLLDGVVKKARFNREKIGYDSQDFVPTILAVGPSGEIAAQPMGWTSDLEKRMKMEALSRTARQLGALAIVMINDARWTNSDKFGAYFHLPSPAAIGLEAWKQEYYSILRGTYGGDLRLLPRELWGEAVIVSMKGPLFEPKMKILGYQKGPNDTVDWTGEMLDEGFSPGEINVLPDWWTESEAKPS